MQVPDAADYATLGNAGSVVHDTTDTIYALTAVSGTMLQINGGDLVADGGIIDQGSIEIAGGTLDIADVAAYGTIASLTLGAAGVLQSDDGVLDVNQFGAYISTIAGTIDGQGTVAFNSGTVSLDSSAVLIVAGLTNQSDLLLQGDASFAGGAFVNITTLNTDGFDFTLATGINTFASTGNVGGGGTVVVAAAAAFLGGTIGGAGTGIDVLGTAYDENVLLGGSLASQGSSNIVIGSAGTLELLGLAPDGDTYINGEIDGTVVNDGLLQKTIDGLGYILANQLTNSGTIDVERGTLNLLDGTATLGGLIEGGGTFELDGEIATFGAAITLNVATLDLYDGAVTLENNETYAGVYDSSFITLNTNGYVLTLDGNSNPDLGPIVTDQLGGVLSGGGTLVVQSRAFLDALTLTGVGTELLDEGSIAAGGNGSGGGFGLGELPTDSTTFSIAAGGTFDILAPSFNYENGAGTLLNAGLLEQTDTEGDSLNQPFFTNTGTIDIVQGSLTIDASVASVGGLVTGAGALILDSSGPITFASGATLDGGTLSLVGFGGSFVLGANLAYGGELFDNATLNTNGFNLDLGPGSTGTLSETVLGGGTVTLGGSMLAQNLLLGGSGTALDVTGTMFLVGDIYTAYASPAIAEGTLDIAVAGTLDLLAGGGVNGFATIDNAGLLEKTSVGDASTLSVTRVLNTGTIAADFGTIDITGALVNDGTVEETGLGQVIVAGGVTGTGVFISDPADITLDGPVGAGQTVSLTGPNGTLTLGDPTQFDGVIKGFGVGDLIVVESFAASAESFVTGTGLELSSGASTITLDLTGSYHTNDFTLVSTGGETEIVICYLRGTRLLTPAGQVRVEDLAIGDTLVSRYNGIRPIKWIGRQSYAARFVRNNRDRIPVRIRAHALGPNLPCRDLYVSPGHSMLLGETLVLAKCLVNGVTITQDDIPDEIHYYLIELESHDCVVAEGTWSESYADCVGLRGQFHNAAEFHALYPGYQTPDQLALCRPRPENGPELEAALRPVVAKAADSLVPGPLRGWIDSFVGWKIQGWAQDAAHPELPVLLEVRLGEVLLGTVLACDQRDDLRAAGIGQGRCSFSFISPYNIRPSSKRISIRRACDGTELPMTADCQLHPDIARNDNRKSCSSKPSVL